MKKIGKYLGVWKIIITSLLIFIVVLLIKSAGWLKIMYGDIAFSTVVYQLLSPLKGTEAGIVYSYINDNIPTALLLTFILEATVIFNNRILSKLFLKWTFSFASYGFKIQLRKYFYPCIVVAGLLGMLYYEADKVGCTDFIKDIAKKSAIYEQEYISPDSIEIVFPAEKRNLILIYMESMETTYASVEEGGAKAVNYIPELTQLAEENVNFGKSGKLGGALQCEGTDWTMAGLLASSTGVNYKLPISRNTEKEYESLWPGLKGIGNILEEAGYNNYYMCGSKADFAGKRTFLTSHGNYMIYDYYAAIEEGLIPEDYHENWGFEDARLFAWAKEKLSVLGEQQEPFSFTMLTADTHFPEGYVCALCDDVYPQQYGNVIACSSKQTADFIRWIQKQPWYENTTIVILGDHISMNETFYDDIGDYERTIYNCFINVPENLSRGYVGDRKYSTMDFFPTILASMGVEIEGEQLGLGVNLFSGEDTLIEKYGFDEFNGELKKNSIFYFTKFCIGENN